MNTIFDVKIILDTLYQLKSSASLSAWTTFSHQRIWSGIMLIQLLKFVWINLKKPSYCLKFSNWKLSFDRLWHSDTTPFYAYRMKTHMMSFTILSDDVVAKLVMTKARSPVWKCIVLFTKLILALNWLDIKLSLNWFEKRGISIKKREHRAHLVRV